MTTYLAKYALATVPRYTSYPPATQFHDGVGEKEYRDWLDEIGSGDTLSLYVHIPFCQTLCWYCGCHTTVPNSGERALDYVDVLNLEIARAGECVSRSAKVVQLHFGGGTPNYLPSDNALKWTRLSCRSFKANEVRLQLHALAYNLGNFLRTLVLPTAIADWSLTSLRDRMIKIGAKAVRYARSIILQLAEVAVPRDLWAQMLTTISGLKARAQAP